MNLYVGQFVLNSNEDYPCVVLEISDVIKVQTYIGVKQIPVEEFNMKWVVYDPNYAYVVYAKRNHKKEIEMFGIYKTEKSAKKHANQLLPENYSLVEVQKTYMPN